MTEPFSNSKYVDPMLDLVFLKQELSIVMPKPLQNGFLQGQLTNHAKHQCNSKHLDPIKFTISKKHVLK